MFAAAALAGCKGKNGAGDVQQDNRVLTKTETAESATVQLTEEFTSEIEPFRENDITPAASGVTSTASWSRWATPCARGSSS